MGLRDLFRQVMERGAQETEGIIQDLRVTEVDGKEHWVFRLDSHGDAEFWFTASSLSRPRKVGERVRVGYRTDRVSGQFQADWIVAADGGHVH